eukprot:TRINITY_DN602_c0_g1_i3.p1 TRINITY_DN602_c0_g1~~TRINITY_DN602_c0_g1_i3.p1  ORF type:complete len:261 (-),score=10.16 TRINITY_DN602_c0_g1_i3:331-1113(-)
MCFCSIDMKQLLIIPFFLLLNHIECTFPLTPQYKSHGPNQLFQDEGSSVKAVNGSEALYNVNVDDCANYCSIMYNMCSCCNSFSYQPSTRTCYLKKRQDDSSDARSVNADGWQSYMYNKDVFKIIRKNRAYAHGAWAYVPYHSMQYSFVGKGPGQVAAYEGVAITTAKGMDGLSGVGSIQCAEECLKVTDCDGFSYNPQQDGGKCFLKKDSASGKYDTIYSEEGWTFFWFEDNVEKCYCNCQSESEFVCVVCPEFESFCF